ncbi:MAG: hypothetical protein Q7U66_16905 [Methylobacter sp.]|nr:hypothetical protein [Methylobacter sp.]
MKIALGIVSGLIVLLGAMFILRKRKKCSSKETLISKHKAPEQETPQPDIKSAAKLTVNAEPAAVNSQITDTTVVVPSPKPISNIETSAKPQAKEMAASSSENNIEFPQDSILKRHYLAHLCIMIEALAPQCPTDSVLCRHYYMMLITKIDQCLNDKKAMGKLIYDYENLSA